MTAADEPALAAELDDIPTPAEVFIAPHDPAVEPVVAEPVVAEPVVAEPVVAEPVVAEPASTTPAETEPTDTEPTDTEPPEITVADLVRAAALAVDGVAGLHSGTFGEVASYLPGRRVEGIRVTDAVTEVHLVLQWGSPVLATADAVRAVVTPIVGTPVDITVQDVVDPHAGTRHQPSPTKETV